MEKISLEDRGIYDVSSARGSQIYLIVGSEKAAVVDAGMAYSAEGTVENIRKILGDRPLDMILLTHSHYDHVSGIPAMKRAWPQVQVYGGTYVEHVFESDKAKAVITKLNMEAVAKYQVEDFDGFDADQLVNDHVIAEGDTISLGDHVLQAYDMPGHSRCSMAFLMDETYLFASETTCVTSRYGTYVPNYLISYKESEKSIHKCAALPMRYVLVPHSNIYDLEKTSDFWNFCMKEMAGSKDVILRMHWGGASEEEIIQELDRRYRDPDTKKEWPNEAFLINQKSMIKTVLREFGEN